MKVKSLAILSVALFVSASSLAQEIRLNGYGAYVFDDRVDSYYSSTSFYDGKVLGGAQWGAGLEFLTQDEYGIEILYVGQDTKVPLRYYSTQEGQVVNTELDVSISYIMLGGVRYMYTGGDVFEPYGGAMLGAVVSNNRNPEPGEPGGSTRFGWGIRLGSNIWATEKVGLKVQALLLSAVQSVGGGFYLGTGGAGAGLTTYSSFMQVSLGGGLVFKLGG